LARRYNQAALLALAVGREAGRPVVADGLRRLRRTPPQGHFSREERRKNVKGAFAVKPGLDVTGQKIVLIDDVLTTGATLGECARLLLKNGAATVDVLILGRVVLSQP
jgi:ComF family protein